MPYFFLLRKKSKADQSRFTLEKLYLVSCDANGAKLSLGQKEIRHSLLYTFSVRGIVTFFHGRVKAYDLYYCLRKSPSLLQGALSHNDSRLSCLLTLAEEIKADFGLLDHFAGTNGSNNGDQQADYQTTEDTCKVTACRNEAV